MADEQNMINLEELNDQQKVWLTQMPYLQLTDEGKAKIRDGGLTVDELAQYLEDPDGQFCGNALGERGISQWAANTYIGRDDQVPSSRELVQKLQDAGLGDIKITDIADDHQTGFQAMAFQDSHGNTGISYRGSDLQWGKGGLADWISADVGEFITNDSPQVQQALDFFDRNKNENGQNYMYGHSLGGNLTAHTYVDRHSEVAGAFTYNGVTVNQTLLDSQEKIDAFNDPKYECTAVVGDIFQRMKRDDLYGDKVTWIKPDGQGHDNWLNAHLPAINTYDSNGNFVTVSRDEAQEYMPAARKVTADILRGINDITGGVHKEEKEIGSLEEAFDRPSVALSSAAGTIRSGLTQIWDEMIEKYNKVQSIGQSIDNQDIGHLFEGHQIGQDNKHDLAEQIGNIFAQDGHEQSIFDSIGDIFAGNEDRTLFDEIGDIFGGTSDQTIDDIDIDISGLLDDPEEGLVRT